MADALGREIARRGWVTLCGGRNTGVMAAVSAAARAENGLTIGILPGVDQENAAPGIVLALPTDLGNARNNVNVLSSDLVIAIALTPGAGTLSEIFLAAKNGKPLLVITRDQSLKTVLGQTCSTVIQFADDEQEAVEALNKMMGQIWNEDREMMVCLRLGSNRNSGS
jgi:hypothetical protein